MVTKDGQPAASQSQPATPRRRYSAAPSAKPQRKKVKRSSATQQKAPDRKATQKATRKATQSASGGAAQSGRPRKRRPPAKAVDDAPRIKSRGMVTQNRQLTASIIAAALFMVGGYLWSIRRTPTTQSITQKLEVEDGLFDELLEFSTSDDQTVRDGAPVEQSDFNDVAVNEQPESAAYGQSGVRIQPATAQSVSASTTSGPAFGDSSGMLGPGFENADVTNPGGLTDSGDMGNGGAGGRQIGSILDGATNPFADAAATDHPPLNASGDGPAFGEPGSGGSSSVAGPSLGAPNVSVPPVSPPADAQLNGDAVSDGPLIVPGAFHNN